MTEPTADDELTRSDLVATREAGASNLLSLVAAVDPAAVGIETNRVAETVARADDMDRLRDRSGHFIAALWEGDLAEALYRADTSNRRLLFRFLSDDVILSALAADRGSMESAESWYLPFKEEYGWPATDIGDE